MEGEARSVFVLVQYICGPYRCGLYEIKIKQDGEVMVPGNEPHDPVYTFFDISEFQVPKYCCLEGARFLSCSKLYLLLNEGLPLFDSPAISGQYDSHVGYIFDTKTRSVDTFRPPLAAKPVSFVMSAYGNLYNLASPECFSDMPKTLFERYDPESNSWKSLPHFTYSWQRRHKKITGYAVCYGCILVSIGSGRSELIVYNIDNGTWHEVNISRRDAYYSSFRGRAVVVDNTIYALSVLSRKVIAFSLMMEMEDDGCIIYSLKKPFFFPGSESRIIELDIPDLDCSDILTPTEYLVHLGKLEFCLLETVPNRFDDESQELFITTFQIVSDGTMHIKILDSSICDLRIKGYGRINVSFSFTPDCDDHEPKKEEILQLAKKKGTEVNGRFKDGNIFMLKLRKKVPWPLKFELSRLTAIPWSAYGSMAILAYVFYAQMCCFLSLYLGTATKCV